MNAPQTISSLIRALRPVTRPFPIHRILARPRFQPPPLLWKPQGLQVAFTTSPTAIPPQLDTSANTSTDKSADIAAPLASPTGEQQDTQYSPRPAQYKPPSEKARQQPTYQVIFTCKPCKHRSSHEMSKQGYHRGTVLITCPGCQNRHVMSDHLNVWTPGKSTTG